MSQDQLYCICHQPYTDGAFYLGCDGCNDWLHGECVGINEFEAVRISKYYCPKCREKTASNFGRPSKLSLKRRLPRDGSRNGESKPIDRPNAHAVELHPQMTGKDDFHVRESTGPVNNFDNSSPPIVGLPNPGGDLCSLNSVMQALLVALHLVDFSSSDSWPLHGSTTTNGIQNELASLLQAMDRANANRMELLCAPTSNQQMNSFAQPHGLALARSLRATHPGRFPAGAQHDAEEVFLSLVDEPEKHLSGSRSVESSSREDSFDLPLGRRLFEGKSHANLECLKCQRKSTRNESFYDVSVHSRGLGDSVRAALQRHWEPTHFSGTDKVMCEKCGHKEDAVRTMTPQQLPKVLVVLLRPPATCERGMQRLTKTNHETSSMRIDLFLEDFAPENKLGLVKFTRWMLCAVVLHTGSTFDSGHYTTAIRYNGNKVSSTANLSSHSNKRGQWVLLDDDREVRWLRDDELDDIGLSPNQEEALDHTAPRTKSTLNKSSPYLLFYTALSQSGTRSYFTCHLEFVLDSA